MLQFLLRLLSVLAVCACVWHTIVNNSDSICGGDESTEGKNFSKSIVSTFFCTTVYEMRNNIEVIFMHRAGPKLRALALAPCFADESIVVPSSSVCQYADQRWFGMQSLRDALFLRFDAAAGPRMDVMQNDTEESMRIAAVEAYRTHYHDMSIVARETAGEQRAGLRRMYKSLDKVVETLIIDYETRALVVESKFNAYWNSMDKLIAPEAWAFTSKVLIARKADWMRLVEDNTDQIREKLGDHAAIHLEMTTNPRYSMPKMPEPTKSEKWALFAKEMLVLIGVVRGVASIA
jgi:hypothetical protein